jgi:hypothetical protein
MNYRNPVASVLYVFLNCAAVFFSKFLLIFWGIFPNIHGMTLVRKVAFPVSDEWLFEVRFEDFPGNPLQELPGARKWQQKLQQDVADLDRGQLQSSGNG